MNLNKCSRCGCFFNSNNNVCPNCEQKDLSEMSTLRNYIEENNNASIENISFSTGISEKNLNRYLKYDEFSSINSNSNNQGNLSINL